MHIDFGRYRDVLRGVDFLHELGNKCLASLVTALQPIRASPGQAIVQMHQVGEEMYIVEGGICSVYFCELSRERQANQKYLAVRYTGVLVGAAAQEADRRYDCVAAIVWHS